MFRPLNFKRGLGCPHSGERETRLNIIRHTAAAAATTYWDIQLNSISIPSLALPPRRSDLPAIAVSSLPHTHTYTQRLAKEVLSHFFLGCGQPCRENRKRDKIFCRWRKDLFRTDNMAHVQLFVTSVPRMVLVKGERMRRRVEKGGIYQIKLNPTSSAQNCLRCTVPSIN